MYAYKVAVEFNAGKEVEKIVKKDYWLNPGDIEAYFQKMVNLKV